MENDTAEVAAQATNGDSQPTTDSSSTTPSTDTSSTDVDQTPQPAAQVMDTETKKSPLKMILIVIITLLIAAAGVAAYLLFTGKENTSSSTGSSTKKDIPNIRYVTRNYGWELFYPATDNTATYMEANAAVFEGLVRYENKTQIVPLLVTGWTNPDTNTWVFNLKKGVKFHTGREMTAEDVKLSFEAAKDSVAGEIYASTIKSVVASGPYQVTITTDGPDPTLLKKLVNYYVYDTKSGKEADPVNGTGPFIVKPNTTPKAESLELVAFDNYHGGRIHVRSLSFIGYDEEDGGKMFNDRKGDITDTQPTAVTRPHETLTVEPNAVFLLALNAKKAGSPLQNQKVRQAIYLAADPVAVGKVRAEDPAPVAQVIPASIPGYNPDVTREARDVNKAKQLLKEAGYPNGITLNFTYFAQAKTTADEIARQLAEAGITLKHDPQTDIKILGQKATTGGTDAFFQTYASDILDASDVLANYIDTPNYTNQDAVDLLKEAQSTFDSSKRLSLLQQASKALHDDFGVIPMYTPKSVPITYDPSYVLQRDINSSNQLGIYWTKVYAK
jgi:peptide/nickel transport system substrate-binding protein